MSGFQAFLDTVTAFLYTNWSIIVSVALGVLLYNFVKKSLEVLGLVVLVGVAIAIATHLGLIPPLDLMFAGLFA